jgi:hypothetical protein
MILRVITGKLRPDVDPETRRAACEDAVKACLAAKGCRAAYFTEPPAGQEGVLAVTVWDSLLEAGNAIAGPLQHGLSGFSVLLEEPPRGRYYPVMADGAG